MVTLNLNTPKSFTKSSTELQPDHVVVQFASNIPAEHRADTLFDLEIALRKATGLRIEVYEPSRGDDSKPRQAMTKEQRAKL